MKLRAKSDIFPRRGDTTLGRAFTAGAVYDWREGDHGDWKTTNDAGGIHLGSPGWVRKNFVKVGNE